MTGREQWASNAGFILATLGCAVGLGNIWRFSYLAGQNGGAAFLLLYLFWVVLICLPLLIAEFAIGRSTQREPTMAFEKLGGRHAWWLAGVPSVLGAFVILAYYPVIAGWALRFFLDYLGGGSEARAGVNPEARFGAFIASWSPLLWQAAIMSIGVAIVSGGIGRGIELANRVLMPLLALLLIGLAGYGLTLPGAGAGLAFVFLPDWSALSDPSVWLAALGQAFFSLSIATGALITYGSYLPRERALPGPALAVALGDTAFAIVAGVMIFPAVFSFGVDPAAGPTLAFVTMPKVFEQMPGGAVAGAAFFGLLVVAAVTSAISLLEVVVAFLVDRFGIGRARAALLASLAGFVVGIPAALGEGPLAWLRISGRSMLDVMDFLASNLILPLNAMLIALFVGWVWRATDAREASDLGPAMARWWRLSLRYLSPLLIGAVLLRSLGWL